VLIGVFLNFAKSFYCIAASCFNTYLSFLRDNVCMIVKTLLILLGSCWKKRLRISDILSVRRRVRIFDLDLNLHMNHACFLGVVQEVLFEAISRSGFLRSMLTLGAVPMIGGTIISYRKQLKAFQPFYVKMTYLGAEASWHVFTFAFCNQDNEIVALGYVKGAAVGVRGDARGVVPSEKLWQTHTRRFPDTPPCPATSAAALDWLNVERSIFRETLNMR
jgi:acyl-CoA thioesterase FadM